MTKKVKNKCAIIGDGIAANILCFYLKKICPELTLSQFFEDSFYPNSSIRSTAIVASRNAQAMSTLGDYLVRSFEEVKNFLIFNESLFRDSIEWVLHREIGNGDNFFKRFPETKESKLGFEYQEQAIMFYPERFLESLQTSHQATRVVKLIKSYDDLSEFDYIFDCTSHYKKFLNKEETYKTVSGSYFLSEADFDKSFSISYFHNNIIYRKKTKELIIGSTSGESEFYVDDFISLKKIYNRCKEVLELPRMESFRLISAKRQKYSKRLPHWGRVSDGLFTNGGYYKNGYQFAFLAAKELSDELRLILDKDRIES